MGAGAIDVNHTPRGVLAPGVRREYHPRAVPGPDASPRLALHPLRRHVAVFAERIRQSLAQSLAPLPPYPAASILAIGTACAIEGIVLPGDAGPAYALYLAGLVAGLGLAQGFAWQALLALLARIPRGIAAALVACAALVGALWLADSLAAFARFGSRYDRLARLTFAVCATGAVGATTLVLLLRPTPGAPRGWLGSLGRWPTILVAVALVTTASALAYADHTLYVGLYLQAHVVLRVGAVWALMFALVLAWGEAERLRVGGRVSLAVAALFVVPFVGLHAGDSDAIQSLVTRPWSATVLRTARGIFDLDRDGFSWVLGGGDCNDFDARVNPSAREIRDNGIDDNCAFGDARHAITTPSNVPLPKDPSPMSVVLITIDTLRWDRLGTNDPRFGPKGRNTMPNLTKWAKRGVNFRRAYSSGGWTSIALGSLMRGLYARRLEWTAYYETSYYRMLRNPLAATLGKGERIAKMFPLAWSDPHEPLPFWLKRRGMRTLAVTDDGFSQMLSRALHVDRGFESYKEISGEPQGDPDAFLRARHRNRSALAGQSDAATATAAISALRWSARGDRYFLWAHFFGPHTPSTRHPGTERYGTSMQDLYDHEVRFTDEQLGRLLRAIEDTKAPTAVFVTADHGERFFTRYRSHGQDLSEDVLRVPLVARVPGWSPRQVDRPVSLIDLMPTILALTGTPAPTGLDGIDLAEVVAGRGPEKRILFSDTWQYGRKGASTSDLVTAFDGKRKIVLDRHDHSMLTYDQRDPSAKPVRVEGLAVDQKVRALMGYIEESGGALSLER